MRPIAVNLFSIALLLGAAAVHGELIVDTKFMGGSKDLRQLTWDEQRTLDPFMDRWKKNTLQAISGDNQGVAPSDLPDRDSGHILWNGKNYYAWAVNYLSAKQDRLITEETSLIAAKKLKKYSPAIPGGGVCALYVFDENLNKLASLKIDLPENNHGTWCNGIYGFGGAGKGIDGVLVTLSYYLAGGKPAQRAQDIGKGWRYMTTLIRFEEQDGKLMLKQDDSCLGNPNQYDTIPGARKVLAKCRAAQ